MEIKIYKSANKVSIMDVLSALDYYTENKAGEHVYKGSIVFLINEYGGSKLIKTAFVPKAEAKYFCREVLANTLERYEHYGGSNANGHVLARIFLIERINNNGKIQYVCEITEGPGYINQSGGYELIRNSNMLSRVRKVLSPIELKVMAGELLDFIHNEELIGRIKNKPLYTIIPENENNKSSGFQKQRAQHNPTVVHSSTNEENTIKNNKQQPIIYAGKEIDLWSCSIEQLSQIILGIVPIKDDEIKLVEAAKLVLSQKQQVV